MESQDLRKAGLKVTLPRLKVLEILEQTAQRHMSAEDVYKALLEMGEEIFRQQQEIETLTKAHQNLLRRIEVLQDTAGQESQQNNERPPHY